MDFFEQICQTLAENAEKYPGRLNADENVRQFFSAVEKTVPVSPPVAKLPPVSPRRSAAELKKLPPAEALQLLAAGMANCSACPLACHRKHVVFGEGDPQAKLMFIGEAPGFDEDIQGRPFVGKAGQLLDRMITAMQFRRDEVYIANIVKCRPDNNRNPMPDEIEKCIGFLHQQINIIRPEVIVLLGATATKSLLNCTDGISRMRGRWSSFENIPVMPTFHPAFLLRQESAKKEAWQDLQQVMARFGKFHHR